MKSIKIKKNVELKKIIVADMFLEIIDKFNEYQANSIEITETTQNGTTFYVFERVFALECYGSVCLINQECKTLYDFHIDDLLNINLECSDNGINVTICLCSKQISICFKINNQNILICN